MLAGAAYTIGSPETQMKRTRAPGCGPTKHAHSLHACKCLHFTITLQLRQLFNVIPADEVSNEHTMLLLKIASWHFLLYMLHTYTCFVFYNAVGWPWPLPFFNHRLTLPTSSDVCQMSPVGVNVLSYTNCNMSCPLPPTPHPADILCCLEVNDKQLHQVCCKPQCL